MSLNESEVQTGPSTSAVFALVLGILSFVGFSVLTAIPAWIIGKNILRDIENERGNPQDASYAKIGVILGKISVALFALGVLAFITVLILRPEIQDQFKVIEDMSSGGFGDD